MKRLLAMGVIGYVIAVIICIKCERQVSLTCFAITLAVFLLSMVPAFFRKKVFFKTLIILFFMVTSFLLFLFFHSVRVENARLFDGYEGKITAQITKLYTSKFYSNLTVNNVTVDGKKINSHIQIDLSENALDYEEGDYVILDGKLKTEFVSFFGESNEEYLASQDIFLLMDAKSIEKSDIKSNLFRNTVYTFRQNTLERVSPLENEGFISALVIGDKSRLDAETEANFQKLGLQHSLAVSGMHLSILVMSLYVFFQRYSVGKYPLSIICSLITVFYMALTGFTFSIVRAGIMMIVYFISLLIRRPNDSITTLFTSALFVMILNPWSIADIGFQLSFFATLGILIFAKPMIAKIEEHSFFARPLPSAKFIRFTVKILKKSTKALLVTFAVSIAATLTTIPIILIYFNSITPLSIIANITVIFLINLVLAVSVIYIILSPILIAPLKILCALICDNLTKLTLALTDILADILPNPLYFTPETSEIIATVCTVLLLVFFIFHKNHKTTIYAALSFIIATALTLGIINIANRKTAFITFSTSNACHDTLIETAEGKTLFSHLDKDSSKATPYQIIDHRKAKTLDNVVIFFRDVSPYEKIEAIMTQSQIKKLILVPLGNTLEAKEKSKLSQLVSSIEYARGKEHSVDSFVSFKKYESSYITISVKQGDNDAVIIYSLNGEASPPREQLKEIEGIVLLGANSFCPRYEKKKFYLCSFPQKIIKNKNTSNTDKFDYGFIKISDKDIGYSIY